MTIKIVTVPTFAAAADVVVCLWEDAGKPKVMRFEGFDGVGKSGLSKLIASRIGASHIEGDRFAFKPDVPMPYSECLKMRDIELAIREAMQRAAPVILDAVCLEEIAPRSRWGRGFTTYVKRLSFNNDDPIWHEWFRLEAEDSTLDEPHKSIVRYHRRFEPHLRSDLIIELPEEGHTIRHFGFDRARCFDPPAGEVLASGRVSGQNGQKPAPPKSNA